MCILNWTENQSIPVTMSELVTPLKILTTFLMQIVSEYSDLKDVFSQLLF